MPLDKEKLRELLIRTYSMATENSNHQHNGVALQTIHGSDKAAEIIHDDAVYMIDEIYPDSYLDELLSQD